MKKVYEESEKALKKSQDNLKKAMDGYFKSQKDLNKTISDGFDRLLSSLPSQ